MDGMSGKPGSFPYESTRLGQQCGHLAADQLVTDGLAAVRMQLVGVGHLPCSAGGSVVVGHGFFRCGVLGLMGVEGVSMLVFGATHFTSSLPGIDLEDGVLRPVDVGIDPHAEEMLMIVSIDARVDFGTPAFGVLAGIHRVGVEDAGKLDLELDCPVLVEDPVDTVFVVRRREDV